MALAVLPALTHVLVVVDREGVGEDSIRTRGFYAGPENVELPHSRGTRRAESARP